jgi:hypothetical protein
MFESTTLRSAAAIAVWRSGIVLTCLLYIAVLSAASILRLQAQDALTGCDALVAADCARDVASQSLLAVAVVAVVGGIALARPRETAARVLFVAGLAFACSMALHSWLWWQVDPDVLIRVKRVFAPVAAAAALHLFLAFPSPQPILRRLQAFGGPALRSAGGAVCVLYLVPLAAVQVVTFLPIGAGNSLFAANLVILALLLGALASVARNYRRPPTAAARAQLKWVMYGVSVGVVGQLLATVSGALSGSGPLLTGTAATLLWVPTWAGIAFAVLRYRLFEIDLIIRRTLVYALLSAFVAGLYAASITLVQRVTIAATGQQSDIVVVFSVLLAATGLWPANKRLQDLVDRSFKQPVERATVSSGHEHSHLEMRLERLQASVADLQPDMGSLRRGARRRRNSSRPVGSRPEVMLGHGRSEGTARSSRRSV